MTPDVKIEDAPKSEVKLTVKLTDKDFAAYKEKATIELGKNVQIKGFRPGHIPKDELGKHINPDGVIGLAIDIALNETYRDAVSKNKIEVMARPKVEIKKEDPLEYIATVAIKPTAAVKEYKKIKVSVKEPKVTDKEIKAAIDELLKGKGAWSDVTRAAKNGDRAELDFQGYEGTKAEKGKEADNTKSSNHPLILGSNSFVPGFEEEVIGMKVGDKKTFTLTFPKEYHVKDFQGKKITFEAELKRLEEQKMPEYNEDFMKEATNGMKTNKKDFEAYVKDVLMQKKTEDAHAAAEAELIEKLIKATKVEFSDQLVADETEVIFADYKKQMESRGIPFEKHIELSGQKEEDIKKGMEEEARKRIVMRFAMDYIIEQEKFTVTDSELKKEIEMVKQKYPASEQPKIDEYYSEAGEGSLRLKNMMIVSKVFGMYLKKDAKK